MSDKCVHTEHCCFVHGCKYRDSDCPVANGTKQQSFPCEDCGFESDDHLRIEELGVLLEASRDCQKLAAKHNAEQWLKICELEAEIDRLKTGHQGACYACEPVGELNVKLEAKYETLTKAYNMAIAALDDVLEESDDTAIKYAGLEAEIARLRALLTVAQCPACDGSGGYYDNYGDAVQCQWCYETKEILGAGDE